MEHLEICQKWAQKSRKSFSDLLLRVPLRGGGYSVVKCDKTEEVIPMN